jgi:hypothetical protein
MEESDGPADLEEDLVICNRHITMIFGASDIELSGLTLNGV